MSSDEPRKNSGVPGFSSTAERVSAADSDARDRTSSATDQFATGEVLPGSALKGVRWGYATRRVDLPDEVVLVNRSIGPRAGDLVLARVVSIGQHARLELPDGRRSRLYVGDEIVVAYANRYAPDQFESEVPDDLGACHLVAAGGIASKLLSRHARVSNPTKIKPVGLLADSQGRPLNLNNWQLASKPIPATLPPVIVVAGTAMNAGKTTAAAHLVKGLVRSGNKVGAAKVTGTGAGGDCWQMKDAGASEVVDFTDAGYASTYLLSAQQVEQIFLRLLSHLGSRRLDAIVVEVADGILQAETAALLSSSSFSFYCDRVIFAAADAMGALAGVQWLQSRDLEVCAVSGSLTASPLLVRETSSALGLPVLSKKQLSDPSAAGSLLRGPGD